MENHNHNGSLLNEIAVIGSGSWATALVKIFASSGVHVSWLVRTEEQAAFIRENGRNPRQLAGAELDSRYIEAGIDAKEVLESTQLVIFAVPAAFLSSVIKDIEPDWLRGKQVAVSIKGFIPGSGLTPSEFIRQWLDTSDPILVLAGPCHAEEIAMHRNTYLTVSGSDLQMVKEVCNSLNIHYLRSISNDDPVGVEYVAILKNIIGIATGIASGLNYGENFRAVVVSNAMREISSFLQKANPGERDLFDSVYFGDLMVTAYSDYSRNRFLGKLVGRGMRVSTALQSMEMIAEGYHASRELNPIVNKLGLSLPIIDGVYRILHLHANPFHEFKLIEQQLN